MDERAPLAIDRLIGQRMRMRRIELGMSQEALAEVLGVTFQQVQKYEKGVNRVAASRLFQLAAALDVTVSYFYEGAVAAGRFGVEEGASEFIHDALATPEGVQLMALFGRIRSAKLRRRILDLVRVLTEEEGEASAAGADD